MRVEIITTGEEVLSGQIVDTNASWLSAELTAAGLPPARRTSVGDRLMDLTRVFRERAREADVVIVNGGLGPTVDDLSAEAAAAALDEPIVLFQEWVDVLTEKFRRNNRTMSPENLKQARLPRSARIIDNPVGTACGFAIELCGAQVYFTPGVPSEFKRMVRHEILPDLIARFAVREVSLLRRLHCMGIAESRLGGMLQAIDLPEGVSLGFRAHLPYIEIKVMGLRADGEALAADLDRTAAEVRALVGANIVCEGDENLPAAVGRLLTAAGATLALAESCTGGMIASQLVDAAGSSAYFQRAYVTYSNAAKTEMVGVPPELIEAHGAVSLEVAMAMASGARTGAGTTYALAVSGIAGPDGGTAEKPVGLVAFGLAGPDGVFGHLVQTPNWGRTNIRLMAAGIALDLLRRKLVGAPPRPEYDLVRAAATRTG